MMARPVISVALATYNGSRYLREQLDSIYAQSYPAIEVVATDDGSDDGTFAILEEYRERHGLRLYRNPEHLGFVRNFERAISLTSGRYVALCDQDDVWENGKLATLVEAIGDASLVHGDAVLVDGEGCLIHPSFAESSRKRSRLKLWEYLIPNRNNVTGCTVLFRAELKETILPIPQDFGYHDHWIALAAARTGGIAYCPEKLVRYRQHASNTLGARPLKRGTVRRQRVESRLRFYRCLQENAQRLNLDASERAMVNDLAAFYDSRLNDCLAWRAFSIALRRFDVIKPDASVIERLWQTAGFLVGMKCFTI